MGRRRGASPRAVPGAGLILKRSRFGELIRRQLDLFEREHAADLAEAAQLLERYNAADRDDAEDRYGDYQDAVDAIVDLLEDLRDAYAATLDDEQAARYERELARAVRRRFPAFALSE